MPCYTGDECATLHRYFLLDTVKECEKTERDIHVFYEPNGELFSMRLKNGYKQRGKG